MARRTRRPRVVWLPQDQFFSVEPLLQNKTVMRASDSLTVNGAGESVTLVAPVVKDLPQNPTDISTSLADLNNSGYRLRRIVGKFWCFVAQTPPDDPGPGACVVTAAFIILRTDPETFAPQNISINAYATDTITNAENPWIWRRSWLLVNNGSANSAPTFGGNSLTTPEGRNNLAIGGNSDGPHIDQKTARIVGPDERLFLVITATSLTVGDGQTPMLLDYVWDVRALATMRTTVGNRRNASR